MIRVYGLRQCDACRKARRWLDQRDLAFEFIDLREQAVEAGSLRRWLRALGEDRLLNRRSATWRQLNDGQRARPALELLSAHPTLIKRPLVEWQDRTTVGFQPEDWSRS